MLDKDKGRAIEQETAHKLVASKNIARTSNFAELSLVPELPISGWTQAFT